MKTFINIIILLFAVTGAIMSGVLALMMHPLLTWGISIAIAILCAVLAAFIYCTIMKDIVNS